MTTLRLRASRVLAPTGHIHAPAHDTYTNGIDWLAVERAASGDWPHTQLTPDETREAALLMTQAGHTEQETSIRLSTYTRQIARWKAAAETQTPPTNTPEATMTATNWRDNARCIDEDPELFFPVGNTGPALLQIEEAKNICRRCPVMKTCLQWAMATGQDTGVWGGMSEDERHELRTGKKRRTRPAQCGTRGGYRAHRRKNEDPCQPCLQANTDSANEYNAKLREQGAAA